MNQCLKISIARGGCRFSTPLYLGSSYSLSFEGERSDEAKRVILIKPRSQNPDDIDGIVVLAESVVGEDGVTLALNRNALVEWFKSNRACDVESTVDAHCYVFNEQRDVIADSPVTIEYSPILFVIDTEDYPLAKEILLQAASARDDAINAKDHAIYAKSYAEAARRGAEVARDEARSARDVAQEAKTRAEEAATTSSTAKQDAITAKNMAQDAKRAAEESASTAETALEKMIASARKVVGGVEVLLWNGQGEKPVPIFIPNGIDGVTGYVKCDEDDKYYCLKCKEVDGEKVLVLEQVGVDDVSIEGYVRAVNGTTPDATGNVAIPLNFLPLSGNWHNPITGNVAFNAVSARICNRHTSGGVVINGGEGNTYGGSLYLQHKDSSSNPGGFSIYTSDGTDTIGFVGTKDGILKWANKNIVRSVNGTAADAAGNVVIPLDFLPLTGGTITGDNIIFTKNTYLRKNDNTGFLQVCGGEGWDGGATLSLRGKEYSSEQGWFIIKASNAEKTCFLRGQPDGKLTWGGKAITLAGDCLPLTGGEMTGALGFSKNVYLHKTNDTGYLALSGGLDYNGGGVIVLRGKNSTEDDKGGILMVSFDGTNRCTLHLKPNGTLTWGGKAVERVDSSSFGTNSFYIKYASGLLIQGGKVDTTNKSTSFGKLYVSFAETFKDTNYRLSVLPVYTTSVKDYDDDTTPIFALGCMSGRSQTGFNLMHFAKCTDYFDWLAIGKWK